MKSYRNLTEALRKSIAQSEIPYLTLEQETGVKRASIMRFMRNEQTLRLDSADKLAEFFKIEVRRKG